MAAQPKAAHLTFDTRIDIAPDKRKQLIDLLNQSLADTFDLYSQIKQAHWNVKGPHFIALHELFDEIAAEILAYVDEIAERVTALGGYATGTARMSAAATRLPEFPTGATKGKEHLIALADRLAAYAKTSREAIDSASEWGDEGTADLYTEVVRVVDKRLWFLEAHLQD